MGSPPWNTLDDQPMVRQLRAMKLKTSMWRRVSRSEGGKTLLVGSISLLSRRTNAYDEAAHALFMDLPLAEAVLRALDEEQRVLEARRLELCKRLSKCTTINEACSQLADSLREMFDWPHVSVYRVDRGSDVVNRVASSRAHGAGYSDSVPHTQNIKLGLLGHVVKSRLVVNVGNVADEPMYLPGPDADLVVSELLVPILFANEGLVRFIINVDDPRREAFSQQHEVLLSDLAKEVAGSMQRITEVVFLTDCFNNVADPIIATDAKLKIRRVNIAAAALFGFATTEVMRGTLFSDYFEDTKAFANLRQDKREQLGELRLKRAARDGATLTVYVERRNFPDPPGGHVFISRDLSKVQLELLERAAYEIAVETQAPLSAATSYLQRLMARFDESGKRDAEKVLRHLARIKGSYLRLSMYNSEARGNGTKPCVISLNGEVRALRASLVSEEVAKVDIDDRQAPSLEIEADPTEISIVLETLLTKLIRAAPEDGKVTITLQDEPSAAVLIMRGKLPARREDNFSAFLFQRACADDQRADPLLRELTARQGGVLTMEANGGGDTEFRLRFPLRSSS
jgi:PAS domain S-box-containing protein